MKKLSCLKTPTEILGVFHMPAQKSLKTEGLILALDNVRDPGNLGTIIRLCDWFGVSQLVCSESTVDCYNPKVVQATMGSLARVQINYLDLEHFLSSTDKPIYGAIMEGENVYKSKLAKDAILVMGNESNGIDSSILKKLSNTLSIPRFGSRQTESLNVATATAILLSEFNRGYVKIPTRLLKGKVYENSSGISSCYIFYVIEISWLTTEDLIFKCK